MKLQQLEYFIAVVDAKNYTKAAGNMYVSRQAISQAVRQLESDLGCQLLDVSETGVFPTPLGKELYEEGKKLLSDAKSLEMRIRQQADAASPLSIAISDTLLPNLEPSLLSLLHEFSLKNPGTVKVMNEIANNQVLSSVKDDYDFGLFLGEQKSGDGLSCLPYRSEPLCLSMPVHHPLSGKEPLFLRDLENFTFMVPGDPSSYFATFTEECTSNGFEPKYRIITPGIEGAYLAEKEELIAPDIPWETYSTRYILRRLEDSRARIVFQMVWKEKCENYYIRLLRDFLLERMHK